MTSVGRAVAPLARYREVEPLAVHQARARMQIVDVREADEFATGHIAGAVHVPLADLAARMAGWNRNQDIVVVCRSGRRSGIAAEQLTAAGFGRVMNMTGGMIAYTAAGLPVEV